MLRGLADLENENVGSRYCLLVYFRKLSVFHERL